MRCACRRVAAVFLFLWIATLGHAVPPPAGNAPVIIPAGGFGIDGDLEARTPAGALGDWIMATNLPGSGGGVLSSQGVPLDPKATLHFVDPYNDKDNDLIFSGGSKWEDDPTTWRWTKGKPTGKADINNLLLHVASDYDGHTWLAMAADRFSVQGESYIDFELLQNAIVRTNNGAFTSSGPHGGRTVNDILLSLGFTGGGKVADFLAWRWEADGTGGYHYVDITPTLPAGRVFIALNTNFIDVPYTAFGSTTYETNAFVEAAIDLTAMIEGVDACEPFGFVAIMVKTKTSTSDAAGIEDFLDPIAFDYRIGPKAAAGPDQQLCSEEGGTPFSLSGTASPGLAPIASALWTVVEGEATLSDSNSLAATAVVTSPYARLRLDVLQVNGCTDSDEIVLTVVPRPIVSISGPATLCPGSVAEFSAPPGMDSYTWSLSGNGALVGDTNGSTVSVAAGAECGQTFELTLIVASNICTVVTTATSLVQDDTPPSLQTGPDRTIECGVVWDFDPVSGFDDCLGTNVPVVIVSTVTNPAAGAIYSATRTWQATDTCGNSTQASQTITVVDTTPPVIICSSNLVAECAGPEGTEVQFNVTAVDVCDDAVQVVCVPPSGTKFPMGVTTVFSLATDASGNTNACSFTVTVQDTTPPTITCPGDITQNTDPGVCEAVLDPGVAEASDICADVSVAAVRSDGLALTNPYPKGITLITWTATDAVGLTNACVQTITVEDHESPTIECPPDMVVDEEPADSGGAIVHFATPISTDNCTTEPLVVCTPPSGSWFTNGETVVRCVATDESGNTNECSFTVRVIPVRLLVIRIEDTGPDTLRQAILDGNASPGGNIIVFDLPGEGPQTIHLESPLPPITSPTTIDGSTQPGFTGAPIVTFEGESNAFDGLVIQAGPSVIRGLSLHGFATAIRVEGACSNVIQGNYIGVDTSGTNALGNAGEGIYIETCHNQIGGTNAGTGNLISGNGGNGITFATAGASDNRVEGNVIGAAYDGVRPLPNGANGIGFTNEATLNLVGGDVAGAANIIAFNALAGVGLSPDAGTRNAVLGNSIFANAGLGIDLGANGPTANDAGDADGGPNNLQNYPILTDVRSSLGSTVIEGQLNSTPLTTYRLEFFLSDSADPSGYGEGVTYLGFTLVSLNETGSGSFAVYFPVSATYTQYVTATATALSGDSSEFSPVFPVRNPPLVTTQPKSTTSPTGDTVTFCAEATGSPPLQFQWRLNGVNIPGATNQCYTISTAELTNGGSYTFIVGNDLDAVSSTSALLTFFGTNILSLPGSDNFADATSLSEYGGGTNGTLVGNNAQATLEPMEPLHAGKPGGRSVWYRWCTPEGTKGITTFRTIGSTFDTLLSVYQGDSVSNLVKIASSDDDARFYWSEVRFNGFYNAPTNQCYYIAVDAFGGNGGEFVLSWNHVKTSHLLPVIVQEPADATVAPGAPVTFTHFSVPECSDGHLECYDENWKSNESGQDKLTYQWYFNGQPIPGATQASYTIPAAQPEHVGNYRVRVFTPWQYLDSHVAVLQLNKTGDESQSVQAVDKFLDLGLTLPIFLGTTDGASIPSAGGGPAIAAATVSRGYTGTQIFNTAGTATDPGEVICGVIGGASEWLTLVPEETGTLFLNTDGSSYDTVMAVFQRNPTNTAALMQLACDNNSGLDGLDSAVVLPVSGGSTNYVLVDGVNGASGILQLNYSLATSTILKVAGRTSGGANIIRVNGRPGLNFSLQASTNMKTWTTLTTTNAPTGIMDYTDMGSIAIPSRYYRALILP